jgi:7,8-dihydropterin-6-yl-methyl-4-(beta-D-ribofuranosyl)aminobenzene 5'-phosphate synthase
VSGSFRISVVYDNRTLDPVRFRAGWGFSCMIEGFGDPLIFDTGASGPVLMQNLAELDLNPKSLRRCVISHDDWDHFGGVWDVVRRSPGIELFIPESMSETLKHELRNQGAKVVSVDENPRDIGPGVRLTGQMPGEREEQGLVLNAPNGTILLTGCAHPGIVSMTRRCIEMSGAPPWLVMGGFHLSKRDPGEIRKVVNALYDLGVVNIGPAHCTGIDACRLFEEKFGEHTLDVAAGKIIEIDGGRL